MKGQRWQSTDRSIELESETADLEIEDLVDDHLEDVVDDRLEDVVDELVQRIDRRAV